MSNDSDYFNDDDFRPKEGPENYDSGAEPGGADDDEESHGIRKEEKVMRPERLRAGEGQQAPPHIEIQPQAPPPRKSKLVIALCLAILLLIAGGGAFFFFQNERGVSARLVQSLPSPEVPGTPHKQQAPVRTPETKAKSAEPQTSRQPQYAEASELVALKASVKNILWQIGSLTSKVDRLGDTSKPPSTSEAGSVAQNDQGVQNAEMAEKINKLHTELKRLSQENLDLEAFKNQKAKELAQLGELQAQIRKLQQDNKKLAAENKQLTGRNEHLRALESKARHELKALKKNSIARAPAKEKKQPVKKTTAQKKQTPPLPGWEIVGMNAQTVMLHNPDQVQTRKLHVGDKFLGVKITGVDLNKSKVFTDHGIIHSKD